MANLKPKILVMEDERPLAHALELKLSGEGYEVVVASSGLVGLELLEESTFDVVLLDLMMPQMDGFQVLEKLRVGKTMPYVIVLSNLGQHEDEEKALSLGAKKYFVKSNTSLSMVVEQVKQAVA
ncbi:MAG: winged helix family two component transcriptional regulator [Candidatus Saccharibacteria bacterium]|nr:winged helix family two component transcriptional regulator [Candidatus Saccharibacteria bacterium]